MTDSDTTNQNSTPKTSMTMHLVLASVVVIVLIGVYLWMSSSKEQAPPPKLIEPVEVSETFEELPVIEPEPEPEPEIVEPDPEPEIVEPEPEPLDISDAAVKTAILALSEMPELAQVLVNDDLLRRFVVFTNNLAEHEIAENHRFLEIPSGSFRIYRQANKEWIDAASFKRYTIYAEALDSIETEGLIALYATYKPELNNIYAQVGDPDEDFSDRLMQAINHLLDTPEIPIPVEVYSDSVMYKFRNERIESLSAPQKQLLRTGPENMRQIKAKLREIQEALEQ